MEGLPDSLCQRGRFFPSKTLARPDIKSGRRGDGGDESQDIEEGRGGDEEFAQAPEGGQDQESQQYMEAHEQDFISFKTDLLLRDASGDPLKKANLINDIADTIAEIPDAVKRSVYVESVAQKFNIESSILFNRITRQRQRKIEETREAAFRERRRREAEGDGAQAEAELSGIRLFEIDHQMAGTKRRRVVQPVFPVAAVPHMGGPAAADIPELLVDRFKGLVRREVERTGLFQFDRIVEFHCLFSCNAITKIRYFSYIYTTAAPVAADCI